MAEAERGGRGSGFWAVAYAFLIVMAFATMPSPLYGLYRTRDDLSALTITIVFAIFAAGTIVALRADNFVAAQIGRRGVMIAAVVNMMIAAGILAIWKDLPALIVGRVLTGVADGLAAGTAIVYLIELRVRTNPSASVPRAQIVGTSISVGALGVGPLVAGFLAQWARWPLTLPYLVFVGLGVLGLIGLATAPETRPPSVQSATSGGAARRQKARLPVPAAAATLAAFAANGLFAGLSGLFLATTLHHPAHALSGATLFLVFTAGVASQLATTKVRAPRVLALGMGSMLIGLALLTTSVRLSSPNLTLFMVAGVASRIVV